ncbi:monosaccharide ABC transporter ATP-binding protein (CUT2 family) [Homoserinimonas aerilata]|uniref:Monosaccharide ABC transporter ATP-binding protein (CUT2 family) n=1 Tax=Homoserinimonas aerilata TaxID=1162970 RepID=A0A542YL03_9MICO|nr:sugar ABC transporter ATP-binding protein [Homoserinimonas aerilata]TQL48772.1 monosaccharide ABC transporter ATP-binding protein (CUT2 family) [Homoserinimonas aerilata]
MSAALRIANVSKTFAGQRALDDVTVEVPAGEVTALLGMNGSGKSTLIKILAGVYEPDAGGRAWVGGRELALPSTPAASHAAGLRFLHQDLGLVDSLTVADNFALVDRFIARGVIAPINRRAQFAHTAATLDLFDLHVHPGALVGELSPSVRTMIGIARAFQSRDAGLDALRDRILVLDEPTASLPADEVDTVLRMLERLRERGGTTIYVSHRIEEVRRIADRVAVLRDGRLVADEPLGARDSHEIVSLIVGRPLEKVKLARAEQREGDPVLQAWGLHGSRLSGVDFSVRAGEIVGVTGLIGCGRSELVRILAGAQQPDAGEMRFQGSGYSPAGPADAVALGVTCVPQNRRSDGVVLDMGVAENLTLGRLARHTRLGSIDRAGERAAAAALSERFLVKAAGPATPVRSLSGGNQQKVVVARAASGDVKAILLDEPSQGVDALATQEIANILRGLAESGVAVVVASTDYDDLVGLADRVVVLNRGRQVAELEGADITGDRLALACTANETVTIPGGE